MSYASWPPVPMAGETPPLGTVTDFTASQGALQTLRSVKAIDDGVHELWFVRTDSTSALIETRGGIIVAITQGEV